MRFIKATVPQGKYNEIFFNKTLFGHRAVKCWEFSCGTEFDSNWNFHSYEMNRGNHYEKFWYWFIKRGCCAVVNDIIRSFSLDCKKDFFIDLKTSLINDFISSRNWQISLSYEKNITKFCCNFLRTVGNNTLQMKVHRKTYSNINQFCKDAEILNKPSKSKSIRSYHIMLSSLYETAVI